jgi:hypothetical protein
MHLNRRDPQSGSSVSLKGMTASRQQSETGGARIGIESQNWSRASLPKEEAILGRQGI